MPRKKISVIGAGNVGAALTQRLAEQELADIVVMDIPQLEQIPAGKGLDILQSAPIYGYDSTVKGTTNYEDTAKSDIVIITAGIARKPGMSRDDLLNTNAEIVKNVTEQITKISPKAIIIVVTNPLDAMCYVTLKTSGFPKQRVIGMAGVLDSSRMATFIAQELKVSVENIYPMVLGGHGDTMIALPRYTTVAGIPLTELLPKEKIDAIIQRTINGGAEIVNLLKTGSAYYAPSASVVTMVESILKDKKKILPCSAYLQGEYDIRDLYVGVPVKLGEKGIEQVIQLNLTSEEKSALHKSAESVEELIETIRRKGIVS